MCIKNADKNDFETAFHFIESLWTYNEYDKEKTRLVYERVLDNPDTFAFFLIDENGEYLGFCHGDYFDTFWMCGKTCYISSLITKEEHRGKGYGIQLMNHAKALAKEQGCRAMILDSGIPRTGAHHFYETYGFEKSCYGFELILDQ
ncbi:MAG: GNAT family N-acetyltransferase [Eubacteriales bacterium]|nr:GNAT family N-acetyltransferase [Eubacteriales bacterium]